MYYTIPEGELCITESGKSGKCILIINCSTALALITKRGKPKVCSFQGKIPIVCCEDVVSSTTSIAANKCSEYKKLKTPIGKHCLPANKYPTLTGCDTRPLEFPHVAILGYGNSHNPEWLCGGSLISENFILTAAHCISSSYGNISAVKLGMHQIREPDKFIKFFTVKNTYPHPQYDPMQSYHDIALIELDNSADIKSGIKPACLYTSKELSKKSFTGIGWEASEFHYNSDILQKTKLRNASRKKCAKFYKGKVKFRNGFIDNWQICAKNRESKANTCQDNSGDPIHLRQGKHVRDSVRTIIGITSVGIRCGTVPAIYTRISHYVPWIESIVWPDTNEQEMKEIGYIFSGYVIVVKLGVRKISEDSIYKQTFEVENTYVHPEYDQFQSYHDIALIQLDRSPYIISAVKPACLHTSKWLPSNYFTGTGWGATEFAAYSDTLQKVKLRHVSYNRCAGFYRGRIKLPYGLMHDRQMCADGGGTGADTCQGDSGGPIQLPRDENVRGSLYTIIGCSIVPSVYTRISRCSTTLLYTQYELLLIIPEGEVCITDSGKKGKCLLIENCSTALTLVRDNGRPKICSFQRNTPIVCCENVISRTLSVATRKCVEYKRSKSSARQKRSINDEISDIFGIGGQDAKPSEFPHMAILGYGNSTDTKWLCGGSLISENFVLTAAHCIYSQYGNVSIVKLGLHQISKTNAFIQLFRVKNAYQHPEYNPLENYHDIALIELDHSANINSDVKPACLHISKQLPNNSFTGTGWGATELYGDNSDILQRVNLSYVSYNNCASFYKGQKKLPKGIIDDWQICADGGGAKADTCQGDSGGPIQLLRDENEKDSLYTIIGITSFGLKCAIVPAIYTRISYYISWIESIVWPN
ncbi:eg:bacr7a4.3 protein-related [Holotrichia oblita]|uniref:Eg:bacr7a4.3 protein-related n=1 Tax=Holotrichia oblita TaxID=644536 RepID=A0ACB9SZR0_HOLOL|nr:eg:bacr7a4.3 protein-related [Holotrichia oblita]